MGSYALLKVCGLAQSGFVMFGATLDIPLAAGVFPVLVVWGRIGLTLLLLIRFISLATFSLLVVASHCCTKELC